MKSLARILVGVSTMAVLSAWLTSASAQEAPKAADLSAALKLQLPSFWKIAAVEIKASVNDGDAVTPKFRQRFTADIVPEENLLKVVSKAGPFAMATVTNPAGQKYRIYGIGSSELRRGRWVTKLQLENPPQGVGKPKSLLKGTVLIAGTSRSKEAVAAYRQALEESKTLAEAAARLSANAKSVAEFVAKTETEQKALLEKAWKQQTQALAIRLQKDLERRKAEVDAMMVENRKQRDVLERAHRERIAALKGALDKDLETRDAEIKRLIAASRTALQDLEKAHKEAVARKIADNKKTLQQLEAAHKKDVEAIETNVETQAAIARAKKDIAAQDELAALLATLKEKQGKTAALTAEVSGAKTQELKKRYYQVRKLLRSKDVSERLAAFDTAMSLPDAKFRNLVIRSAWRSDSDELQAAALKAFLAGNPQFSIVVSGRARNDKAYSLTYTAFVTDFNGSTFAVRLLSTAPGRSNSGTGQISRDGLVFDVEWENKRRHKARCNWNANIDAKGVLRGPLVCHRDNRHSSPPVYGGNGTFSY